MPVERLQKYLARSGVASRRSSEELISQGRVKINGRTVTELGTKVDSEKDLVTVNGKPVNPAVTNVYYMLNKPVGYITTASDELGRPTVLHLLSTVEQRVFPVGRLDSDTEGLLFITNDGEFANKLTHPRFALDKEYLVEVLGLPSKEAISRLQKGVVIEERMTAPAEVSFSDVHSRPVNNKSTTWLRITIHEGRKRQVRRMCEAVGHPVSRLIRVRVGPFRLGELPSGAYRELTAAELAKLSRAPRS